MTPTFVHGNHHWVHTPRIARGLKTAAGRFGEIEYRCTICGRKASGDDIKLLSKECPLAPLVDEAAAREVTV